MRILITGTAGFIGYHLVKKLLQNGKYQITGLDSINDYYDVNLKYGRLNETGINPKIIQYNKMQPSSLSPNYQFIQLDLTDQDNLTELFRQQKFDLVCNLAAQAGVRYSIEQPRSYIDSNLIGFYNILENCRYHKVKHLVYASSSSVYGLNEKMPLSTHDHTDHPISLYAATKKSNEMMAHSYSHLYAIPTTGLRFFTVYGPWGRPDMALFKFTRAILSDEPIEVYNHGKMVRDFTYIDDIVEGVWRVIEKVPQHNPDWNGFDPNPSFSSSPYRIFNIGNSSPVNLMDFIHAIEETLGKKAKMLFRPMQLGDVPKTNSDTSDLEKITNFKPKTTIREGVKNFIQWYESFYKP